MVSWKFYAGRRRVTVESVLRNASIEDYESLKHHLKKLGVKAPPFKEVEYLFLEKAKEMHVPNEEDIKEQIENSAKKDTKPKEKVRPKSRQRRTRTPKKVD